MLGVVALAVTTRVARALVATALAGMVLASSATLALAQTPGPAPALAVDEVRPGVFVHLGAIEDWGPAHAGDVSNFGFVVGSRCVAVIDTGGTPRVGEGLRAAVEHATRLPVCYVILTHAHPDHVLGALAFTASRDAAPRFVASRGYARALAAREPHYLNALRRDFGLEPGRAAIVYPTIQVDRTLDLDLGERTLTLQAWPTAHTDNDLTVYDRRTRTLFASDLLFIAHLPVLDGSLRGWLSVLADLRRLDVATVVPGHGPVSADWRGAVDTQAGYLNGLLGDTRAAIRELVPIRQAVDRIGIAGGSNWRLTDRFHRRNVTAAYAELEWEDDPAIQPAAPGSSASSASGSLSPARSGGG